MGCIPNKNKDKAYSIFHKINDISSYCKSENLPFGPVHFNNFKSTLDTVNYNSTIAIEFIFLNHNIKFDINKTVHILLKRKERDKSLYKQIDESEGIKPSNFKRVFKDIVLSEERVFIDYSNTNNKDSLLIKKKFHLPVNLLLNQHLLIEIIEFENLDTIDYIKLTTRELLNSLFLEQSYKIITNCISLALNVTNVLSISNNYILSISVPFFNENEKSYYLIIYNTISQPIYKSEISSLHRQFNLIKLNSEQLKIKNYKDEFMIEFYSISYSGSHIHTRLGISILSLFEIKEKSFQLTQQKMSNEDAYFKSNSKLIDFYFKVFDFEFKQIATYKIDFSEQKKSNFLHVLKEKNVTIQNFMFYHLLVKSKDVYTRKKINYNETVFLHSKKPSYNLHSSSNAINYKSKTFNKITEGQTHRKTNTLDTKHNNKNNTIYQSLIKYVINNITINQLLYLTNDFKDFDNIESEKSLENDNLIIKYSSANVNMVYFSMYDVLKNSIDHVASLFTEDLLEKRNNYYIIIIFTESNDYSSLAQETLPNDIKNLLIDAGYLPLSYLFVVDKSNNEEFEEIKKPEIKSYNQPSLRLNFELLYLEGDDISKEIEKFSFALGNLTNHIEQYYSLNREVRTP